AGRQSGRLTSRDAAARRIRGPDVEEDGGAVGRVTRWRGRGDLEALGEVLAARGIDEAAGGRPVVIEADERGDGEDRVAALWHDGAAHDAERARAVDAREVPVHDALALDRAQHAGLHVAELHGVPDLLGRVHGVGEPRAGILERVLRDAAHVDELA